MIYEGPGWRIETNEDNPVAELLAPYRAEYPRRYTPPPLALVDIAGLPRLIVCALTIVIPLRGTRHIEIDTGELAVCLPHPRRVPDVG
jgi:hypothetical protein